jgi:hypothetical protein
MIELLFDDDKALGRTRRAASTTPVRMTRRDLADGDVRAARRLTAHVLFVLTVA